jgi:hypothetical protein
MDPNVIDLWTRRPIDPFALGWFDAEDDLGHVAERAHPTASADEAVAGDEGTTW